jgi:hypothetical protein
VRTFFEIEQQDEYQVAQELLVRRCVAWAQERGLPADPLVLAAALDSRHLSTDGRLALWRPDDVRRLLLEWIPKRIAADASELTDAPQSLRTLLRFLVASGLWDPRGASLEENEAAIAEVAAEFPAVLADPERWGVGKFWALAARDNGVDVTDPRAMSRFTDDIREGRAVYDGELLDRLMHRQFFQPEPEPGRAFTQLPVSLPPAEELAKAAARSRVVRQLIAFTGWVGADDRTLTAAGNLKPADARELVALLDTGEQHLKVRTSTDLPYLNLIFVWAKKARLVRTVNKTRLVQVAKAKPLLRDAEALWQRAFDTFFELRDVVCLPLWAGGGTSLLYDVFADAIPDVLNTIYSMPHPMPVLRLEESVWMSCRQQYSIDAGTALQQEHWRGHVGVDLARVFDVLAALGAVDKTHGVADEMFSVDLADDFEVPIPAERPISGPAATRLREELAKPGDLVALTALGTRAMRARLLAEGRDAGLVGDLAAAEPAELLGVVSQHYPPETAKEEINGWLAGHGGDIEPLVDAVRASQFRGRAAAMLNALGAAAPDRTAFLQGLRDDPVLAPLAVTALHDDGVLDAGDMTDRERTLVMTEAFLQLYEMGGPDAIREAVSDIPKADRAGLVAVMRGSGHPGTLTLQDFQEAVADLVPGSAAGSPLAPRTRPAGPGRPGRPGRRPGRARRR